MKVARHQLLVSVLMLLGQKYAQSAVSPNQNAKHFNVLCGVYNAIKSPMGVLYNPTELKDIVGEIDTINASLSDDTWFKDIEASAGAEEMRGQFKAPNGNIDEAWANWKAAVNRVKQGDKFKKLSTHTGSTKMAQIKLKNIEDQVKKILSDIEADKKSVDVDGVESKFREAIGDVSPESRSGGRDVLCGKGDASSTNALKTRGTAAGINLVGDFLCLCSKQMGGSSGAAGNECAADAPGAAINVWSSNGGSAVEQANEKVIWQAIQGSCNKTSPAGQTRSERVRDALERFQEALKESGAKGTGVVPGLFGKINGDGRAGCKGQDNSNDGVCVYYGPGAGWETLEWPKKVRDGLQVLENIETTRESISHKITQLKMLNRRAEEVYEETRAILELENENPEKPTQNQSQKQNPAFPTDKTTAQEPGAASIAAIPRFIFPWTLLL